MKIMVFSSKKLALLITTMLFVLYIRFSGIGISSTAAPMALNTNDDAKLVVSKVDSSQSPLHSTKSPAKYVFLILQMISKNENKTTDHCIATSESTTEDIDHSSSDTQSAPSHPRKRNMITDDGLKVDTNDGPAQIDHSSTPSVDYPKPFLCGARPFQPYRQYMSDCGMSWWLWFIYILVKMVAFINKKRTNAKLLRTKLYLHLPSLLPIAWVSTHLICLVLRPVWTVLAFVAPLLGIALVWSDLKRIGRKLTVPPAQDCIWLIADSPLNAILTGLLLVLTPWNLVQGFAILYALNAYLFPRIHLFFRPYINKVNTKLGKFAPFLRLRTKLRKKRRRSIKRQNVA